MIIRQINNIIRIQMRLLLIYKHYNNIYIYLFVNTRKKKSLNNFYYLTHYDEILKNV